MNFRRKGVQLEEPEINLVPLIDVMLVIIIFLMLTTTYSRFSGVDLNLPSADKEEQMATGTTNEINISISATGDVMINRIAVTSGKIDDMAAALGKAIPTDNAGRSPVVIISADAKATHQRVIEVMQAAQRVGLTQITFATQNK